MRILLLVSVILLAACVSSAEVPTSQVAVAPDRLLEYGGAQADALQEGYAAQAWLFVAQADEAIRLIMRSDEPLALALTAPDGQIVAQGSSITLVMPVDGTYTATVSRDDTAGTALYTLALLSAPLPTATTAPTTTSIATATSSPTSTPIYAALGTFLGRLASGQTIDGRFERAGETQVITFAGMAGQYLFLRLQPLSGMYDPALTLFDSQANVLITDEESGGIDTPFFDLIQLPQTDTYIVQIRADTGGGDYRLEFRLDAQAGSLAPTSLPASPTPPLSALVSPPMSVESALRDHRPASGQIERPGDFSRFTIEGQANDALTVAVHAAGDFGLVPAFEVYDPEGRLLHRAEAAQGSGALALAPAVTLPVDGIFSVFVLGLRDTTGRFTIAYGLDGSHTDNLRAFAPPDAPAQAILSEPGMRDVWFIALNAGDVITAAVVAESGGFDPALELTTADGVRIAYDDNGTQNPVIQQASAPHTGTYLLRVTGANAASAGSYRLIWRYVTAASTPTPQPSVLPLMAVDNDLMPGASQEYPFLGQAGQRIRVMVAGVGDVRLDPLAAVIAPDGNVLIEVDDSGASLDPQFDLTLSANGVYRLRVGSYGVTGGAFIARVERLVFE
ncbi:MAG: hypothetical protein IH587_14860 [Anaerolineae bacterium]|nr:hypothetical protein [Anaerolineae bacterium]